MADFGFLLGDLGLVKSLLTKGLGETPLEKAIQKTNKELKENFKLELYDSLCKWCVSDEFKGLLEDLKKSKIQTSDSFEHSFQKISGCSSDDAKSAIPRFFRHLEHELIRENPGLLSDRVAARADNTDSKLDQLSSQMLQILANLTERQDSQPGPVDSKAVEEKLQQSGAVEDSQKYLPADWGREPFSDFFCAAEFIVASSCKSYEEWAELLKAFYELSCGLNTFLAKQGQVLSNLSIFKAHSTVMAASRLALGGQIAEAHTLIRETVFETMLALYLTRNPDKQELFSSQNDHHTLKNKARELFKENRLLYCLKSEDILLFSASKYLLDVTSIGAFWEGTGQMTIVDILEEGKRWQIGYLPRNDRRAKATVKLICHCQAFRLLTAGSIYPQFLEMDGRKEKLANLIKQTDSVIID